MGRRRSRANACGSSANETTPDADRWRGTLTSMLKRVDVAVYEAAKAFQPGVTVLGLKEGGVDYAMDEYNAKPLLRPCWGPAFTTRCVAR